MMTMKNMIPTKIDAIPGIMKITHITREKGPDVRVLLLYYEHLQNIYATNNV